MTIDGKIGEFSRDDERARAGEPHIIRTGKVQADQGDLPMGLVCTKNADGEMIPYAEVSAEVLGAGDGSKVTFAATLAAAPAEPGSVTVTDGVETFSDDGFGRLTGSAGGSGTVNYATGAVSVTFDAAVGNGVDVTADYVTAIDGVLDEPVDTTRNGSAQYVAFGLVRQDVLKVGATAQAAPDTTLLGRLEKHGIYAS